MNALAKAADKILGKEPVSEGSAQPQRSSTETMKAITWHGKKDMRVSVVPKPVITHPQDVIVKITSCTICSGSDGHMYAGEIPGLEDGAQVGHEAMGIVESKGSDVKKLQVGDRVIISFCIACGKCEPCKKEQYTACDTTNDSTLAEKAYGHAPAALFGYGQLMSNVPGSQAEYVRVPFADLGCYKVPDGIPDEKALFLSDVVCTSLCGIDCSGVKKGETVCIWGLGPIGLCASRWAQIKGASRVVAIDLVRERLALAKTALGIDVVNRTDMTTNELTKKLLEMEPNGFDHCIECVGFRFPMSTMHKIARATGMETDTAELIDECLTVVKKYGSVFLLGDYAGYANAFPIGKIMFKGARLSSRQANVQHYFPEAMKALQDGLFDPTFIVTHRITLDQIPEYYNKLAKKEDGCIKVFCSLKDQVPVDPKAAHGYGPVSVA